MSLYPTAFALVTISLFLAMWLITPYAAASIAHQYDSVHQWNANATFVRLRARKQLMMSRHNNNSGKINDDKELQFRHHRGRYRPRKEWIFVPVSSDATMAWLRRLRLVLMV